MPIDADTSPASTLAASASVVVRPCLLEAVGIQPACNFPAAMSMRKILSAACVAAFTLPAFAAWEARLWEGNLSYYDTVHNMTWSDGVRDIGPEQEMFPSWNSRYYSGNFPAAPTLDQLIGLNHARQESDPFLHLTEYGPFHSHIF